MIPPPFRPATGPTPNPPARRHRLCRALLVPLLALAAAASGCTWFSPRPLGLARSVFNIQPDGGSVGSEGFEAAMDRHTGSIARDGNRVTLLQNGDEAFPAMLDAIRSARHRISMEMYIVEDDQVTDTFYAALSDAVARGVEVRFIADAVGFRRGQIARVGELNAKGVQAQVFNPLLASWTVLRFNNRDHRKIIVVDGHTAIMGGLNLSDEQSGDGVTGWRDTAVKVEGPAARDAEAIFAQSWRQAGRGYFGRDWPFVGTRGIKRLMDKPVLELLGAAGASTPFDPPPYDGVHALLPPDPEDDGDNDADDDADNGGAAAASPPPPVPGASVRALWTDPVEWTSPLYEATLLAVNGATESVDIVSAYFAPPRALRKALTAAARRGVRVRLLLPGVTDVMLARPVSEAFYAGLLKAGVEIYEWPHFILHSKTMVVDRRWSLVGSANIDSRSFALSYEASFAITSQAFGQAMEDAFERDLARSARITLDRWRGRSLGIRVRETILTPMGGQF